MNAQARIQMSWIFLVLGGVLGISRAPAEGIRALPFALLTGYVLWALYWGIPAFWVWWKRSWPHWKKLTGHVATGWLFIGIIFGVFLAAGYSYCVFGGGIYQFTRAWRSTRP